MARTAPGPGEERRPAALSSAREDRPASTRSTRWRRSRLSSALVAGVSTVVASAVLPMSGAAATDTAALSATTELTPLKERWGDDTTAEGEQAAATTGTWEPDKDRGSLFWTARDIGAQAVWGKADPAVKGGRLTGRGVGVALLDTGVTPVAGLQTPGKLVNGPDLSFESQSGNTRHLDAFGHGTHMAAIIAGRDSAAPSGGEADKKYSVGMAPDATLVNVKLASADGSVDVSQVVAGIDWVVRNRASHNIRVINLSYGTDSIQETGHDPLAHAVESAWRAGIVVVVAAGNDGEAGGEQRLTMPAIDPFVLAVGSSDHRGSDDPRKERVGTWTNEGSSARRADLLAPGKSVVSLRVPGSVADLGHPEGLVPGDASGRFFRGTGTSQSAAVVSGAVALLLQRNPNLTPDQVKGLLKATGTKLSGEPSPAQGAGELDVRRAVEQLERGPIPSYTQTFPRSTGTGSLEASRGGSHVVDPVTGEELRGEQDIFGEAWNAQAWAAAASNGTAWSGGTWRGRTWAGGDFSGSSWAPAEWSGSSWTGIPWSLRSWSASRWSASRWSSDDWSASRWSASRWSASRWSTYEVW